MTALPIVSTYSMWSLFRNCRKAVEWRYIEQLVPLLRDHNLHFGSLIHDCLELWHGGRDLVAVLDRIDRLCPIVDGKHPFKTVIIDTIDNAYKFCTDSILKKFKIEHESDLGYQARSTLLTSQLPVASWHAQIGDPTIADSILDRLVHNAHRLELQGESLRKKRSPKSGKESV
jgi:hypothetical protein